MLHLNNLQEYLVYPFLVAQSTFGAVACTTALCETSMCLEFSIVAELTETN